MLGKKKKTIFENRIFNEDSLNNSISMPEKIKSLFRNQLKTWSMLQNGVENLSKIKIKNFIIDESEIIIQLNPQRIKSTTAEIKKKNNDKSECILCLENLPSDQKGLVLDKQFLVLCNPYPIFDSHFTIVNIAHIPQQISDYFPEMLDIAKSVSPYFSIFYNGPLCGASVPDHLHFQLCAQNFVPLEKEHNKSLEKEQILLTDKNLSLTSSNISGRKFFTFSSSSKSILSDSFNYFYDVFAGINLSAEEPKMNIFCWYENNKWIIKIFPRQNHRPSQYYYEDDRKLVVSPASVDLCGIIVTPSEETFLKITADDIKDIFKQASLSNEYFEYLLHKMKNRLK
ncbi:MAG: DUF4922 domain-containing protein [Ignavibacteria bacterium]|nr:DUF4922 domain-containing protein [Ignavibacteria bacterium]